ncbi:MFS transporter [Actinocrispum wychmicini]|uniref:Putative MFS family arabinose efflux permease n=1 Tax=Actinocrispum wychmicini TaxID=1213861 RepID=A0A4R2J5C1_9PSEU|nr:MFS transporter [Actinocrispum wychmicini]TCO54051.1 putative MFS family arabinose efflux permease [Actinocrispum wychmicini]
MSQQSSRWSVIVVFALFVAATQVIWLNFAGVSTAAAAHYGVSETAVGWLAQVFPLLYVVLAIPAGLVLDRNFRGGLAVGAVLTALGAVMRLVGDNFGWVLAGQTVAAIAQPLVLNAITVIAVRYLVERHRPAGIAISSASTFAGSAVVFVLTAVLPEEADLNRLLTISTLIAVVTAVALLIALRTPMLRETATVSSPGRAALRVAWNDKVIRRLCLLVFCTFGVFVALTTFTQPLLEPAGVSGSSASWILLVNVIAGVAGSMILPIIAVRRGVELPLLVAGVAVAALGCVTLAFAPGTSTGMLSLLVIGFLLMPSLPIVLELTERRAGGAQGTATGLIWLCGNVGSLVVATVVGFLVDQPTVAFLVIAVVALLGVPVTRLLRSHLGGNSSSQPAGPAVPVVDVPVVD